MTEQLDYLDLLTYLNPKNLNYQRISIGSKKGVVDGNTVASALAGLDDWVQAWAYILANHQARSGEIYLCQRVLMSIIFSEMAQLNVGDSRKLIYANNIAWAVINIQTHQRTRNSSMRELATECDIDKQTFARTYAKYYRRAEQEIATWENMIRDNIKGIFKD